MLGQSQGQRQNGNRFARASNGARPLGAPILSLLIFGAVFALAMQLTNATPVRSRLAGASGEPQPEFMQPPTVTPPATAAAGPPTVTPSSGTAAAIPPTVTPPGGIVRPATVTPLPGAATPLAMTATPTPIPNDGRLGNISTRGRVGRGDTVMIGGFIVRGAPVEVIVRAIGPSLADRGVPNPLEDPTLDLHVGPDVIASNDDWVDSEQRAQIEASVLKPEDPRESMLILTLPPGEYTAIVRGVDGAMGNALVEIFHASGEGELSNISTRGDVRLVDEVMIGGFIASGGETRVIIRAIGPSLADREVPDPLEDPTLELYSGSDPIAFNDDWQDAANAAQIQASGLAPTDPRESVILITLQPGAYTAIVRGKDGRQGIALVEVFQASAP